MAGVWYIITNLLQPIPEIWPSNETFPLSEKYLIYNEGESSFKFLCDKVLS